MTVVAEPVAATARPRPGTKSRPAWAAFAAVVAIGIVLRFWTRSHLWLDEALTVNLARLPIRRIPGALRHDGAPPLYYFLLHGWMRLFGTSSIAVRAFSGLTGVAALPLMWLAGRRAGGRADGRRIAPVAVALLASSPFAIRYSTEARMYSLVVLLCLIGYLALARIIEQRTPRRADLVLLAVVSGLLLLTHYWSLYLLVTVGAVLLFKALQGPEEVRGRYRAAILAMAAGAILFVPWVPSFVYQLHHTGTPWAEPASFSAMVNAVSEFAGGRSSTGRALGLAFFALAGFGLCGAAIDRTRVELDLRTRPRGRGLALAVAGTLGIAIAIGFATHGAFAARYAAVAFVPFLLLVTLGTAVLSDRKLFGLVVGAAVLFGLATSTGNIRTDRTQAAQIATRINQELRPGDVVGYCPDQLGPAVSRVLPPGVAQVTFPRLGPPTFVDWVDYGVHNRAGDPGAYARLLDRMAGPGHTVWMVWASEYRTLGTKCEQINSQLGALRPNANQLLEADTQHFYEHASLVRYLPR